MITTDSTTRDFAGLEASQQGQEMRRFLGLEGAGNPASLMCRLLEVAKLSPGDELLAREIIRQARTNLADRHTARLPSDEVWQAFADKLDPPVLGVQQPPSALVEAVQRLDALHSSRQQAPWGTILVE